MSLNLKLRQTPGGEQLVLEATDDYGNMSVVTAPAGTVENARKDQTAYRKDLFAKLGATCWRLGEYADEMPGRFVAASTLTSLRRRAVEAIERARQLTRPVDKRRPINFDDISAGVMLRNVANSRAERLCSEIGVSGRPAVEVSNAAKIPGLKVMECKYCLRKELGACLKTPAGKKLAGPLFLDSERNLRYKLNFDCKSCVMWLELV